MARIIDKQRYRKTYPYSRARPKAESPPKLPKNIQVHHTTDTSKNTENCVIEPICENGTGITVIKVPRSSLILRDQDSYIIIAILDSD